MFKKSSRPRTATLAIGSRRTPPEPRHPSAPCRPTWATDGSGLYREQYPVEAGDNAYSYEWPFSQVHIAIAVAALFVPAAASASPAPSHSTPGASPASVATANAKSAAGC